MILNQNVIGISLFCLNYLHLKSWQMFKLNFKMENSKKIFLVLILSFQTVLAFHLKPCTNPDITSGMY